MKKFIQNKLKEQKGLTLIELLAVIVIIAIIAAIAIPAIGNIIENSRHNAAKADVQNVMSSASLYFTETGSADNDEADLTVAESGTLSGDLANFVDDPGNVTTATVTKLAGGNEITATVVTDQGTYQFTDLTNNELSSMSADDIEEVFTAS